MVSPVVASSVAAPAEVARNGRAAPDPLSVARESLADLVAAAYAAGRVTVEQHPQGGWTHGLPAGGNCRVFSGWWPTRRQASKALK
jgi:hypothetical protein